MLEEEDGRRKVRKNVKDEARLVGLTIGGGGGVGASGRGRRIKLKLSKGWWVERQLHDKPYL